MAIKFLSGFRGIDNAKQGLRRSSHVGSDLTSGYTVLAAEETFDPQACFVYLNGILLKEGSGGSGGDYTLSGNATVTFNSAVNTTDTIEVISYNFANPTNPQTMIEVDHTVSSSEASYHATNKTSASYTAATDTLTLSSHGLSVDDVIDVTASPTSGSLAVGRYRVSSVTDANNVVLRTIDDQVLTYSTNSASANINYTQLFSKRVNNLTLQNRVLVFKGGALLKENTDFVKDRQAVTLKSGLSISNSDVLQFRHFGSFIFPTNAQISNAGLEVADDGVLTLLTNTDIGASNVTSVFNLVVNVRNSTATNDGYRSAEFAIRCQKNSSSSCYGHKIYDVGNIGTQFDLLDSGNYSSYSSVTDGNVGIGLTTTSDYWYVYLVNRSSSSVIVGFEATGISN